METLHSIFCASSIEKYGDGLILGGFLSTDQFNQIRSHLHSQIDKIRPQLLGLVESFDLDDEILYSEIGSSDGKVYERMYEAALSSPLNKKDKVKGFDEFIKPTQLFLKAKL